MKAKSKKGKKSLPTQSKYIVSQRVRNAMAVGISTGPLPKSLEPKKDELDFYKSPAVFIEAYDGVEVTKSPKTSRLAYNILLPELEEDDWELIRKYKELSIKDPTFDFSPYTDIEEKKKIYSEEIRGIIKSSENSIPKKKLDVIVDLLTKTVVGYGLLEFPLSDDRLEEVMVIGENKSVYVFHRTYGMCLTNIALLNDTEVVNISNRISMEVGKKLDMSSPLLDARLKDGSRVNATIRPITPGGATLTIRKFMADPMTVIDLVKNGTLSIDFASWLWVAVDGLGVKPANIIISGGTSSGKTTNLNVLAAFIPEDDRIITIEDTAELQLNLHDHWIQMETRPVTLDGEKRVDMNDCLVNTLRMRPDRIIVGEVRGSEADTLFAAMNTGHDGCMGTVHANDAKETITRLTNPPMNVPMVMLPALDLIIIQGRFKHPKKGYLRRTIEVSEVAGMETGKVLMNKIYTYNVNRDELVSTGTPSRFIQNLSKRTGIKGREINTEIEKRRKVLSWLLGNDKRSMNEVKEAIILFNRDQDLFIEKINILNS
jgi:flagellar protein FlaI